MSLPGPAPRWVSSAAAASYLSSTYGWTLARTERVLDTATAIKPYPNNEPTEHGYAEIIREGAGYRITDCGVRHRHPGRQERIQET
jgi:hypothetical protein